MTASPTAIGAANAAAWPEVVSRDSSTCGGVARAENSLSTWGAFAGAEPGTLYKRGGLSSATGAQPHTHLNPR